MSKDTYYDLVTIMRLHRVGLLECLEGFSPKDEITHTSSLLPVGKHRILVGQASRLIEKILDDRGSREDLLDAIKYGLCALDFVRYRLDPADAQIKFRYQELWTKYLGSRKEKA